MKIIHEGKHIHSTQEWLHLAFLVLGLLLAAAIGFLIPQADIRLVLGIGLVLLVLVIGITVPFCCLILIVYLDLWFPYVDLYWVPPRNYVLPLIFLAIALSMLLKGKVQINRRTLGILSVSLGFIGWAVVVNLMNDLSLNFITYQGGRHIMQVLIFLCTVLLMSSKFRLTVFLYSVIAGVAISSFVAIMQFANVDFFWQLRASIGLDPDTIVGQQILTKARVPGLAYFAIPLANQLSMVAPLMLGILVTRRGNQNQKVYLWAVLFILLGGLLATMTRSAIMGVFAGFALIFLLVRRQKFTRAGAFKIGLLLLLIVASILLIEPIRSRFFYLDESAYARLPLALVAFKVWLAHPLGVGTGQFSAQPGQFFSEVAGFRGAQQILYTGTHNQFLSTLVYYGLPGFLLLLILYKQVLQTLRSLWKEAQDPWVKGVTLGLLGSFVSYLVNSLFHNAGPFIFDPFHWYFIGLAVALWIINRGHSYAGKS